MSTSTTGAPDRAPHSPRISAARRLATPNTESPSAWIELPYTTGMGRSSRSSEAANCSASQGLTRSISDGSRARLTPARWITASTPESVASSVSGERNSSDPTLTKSPPHRARAAQRVCHATNPSGPVTAMRGRSVIGAPQPARRCISGSRSTIAATSSTVNWVVLWLV